MLFVCEMMLVARTKNARRDASQKRGQEKGLKSEGLQMD
jgi:hypothetical protein